jgi:FkbM family methyltransferase
MLRSIAVFTARAIPSPLKRWIHRHKHLSRFGRKVFAGIVGLGGNVVAVEDGPLKGMRLVMSEHVSHAHISGTYERETQLAIDRLIAPGFICYDLGASVGYLSLLMARKAQHVYSFEPAPHALAHFRGHIEANALENITIVEKAVSDCERVVKFGLTDNAYGSRIVESSSGNTLQMTTTTLDDFVASHPPPDFIKIDVENEEGRVLEGARTLLRDKHPLICCELHSVEAAQHVQTILHEYGYKITTLSGEPFKITGPIVPGDLQVIGLPSVPSTEAG